MGFFDDFTQKLSVAGDAATKKAKELAELGRVNWKIAEEERKLAKMFELLGSAYYEAQKSGSDADFADALADITAQKAIVEEAKIALAKLKNNKICAKCGAICPFDAEFCPKCGKRFAEEAEANPPEQI